VGGQSLGHLGRWQPCSVGREFGFAHSERPRLPGWGWRRVHLSATPTARCTVRWLARRSSTSIPRDPGAKRAG